MVGVASGALSAAEADGILGDFVHSAPVEHRDRKLQRGRRIGCLPVIVLNRLDPRIDRVRGETEPYSREQLLAACDLKPLEALRATGSTR